MSVQANYALALANARATIVSLGGLDSFRSLSKVDQQRMVFANKLLIENDLREHAEPLKIKTGANP